MPSAAAAVVFPSVYAVYMITETKRACGDARKIDVDSSRNEAARIVTHAARRPGRMSGSTMAR